MLKLTHGLLFAQSLARALLLWLFPGETSRNGAGQCAAESGDSLVRVAFQRRAVRLGINNDRS